MNNRERALELVLCHNRLKRSVKIIELSLDGLTPKEISKILEVSLPQISKVKGKYLTPT